MNKRIVSLLVVLSMLVSLMSFSVGAAAPASNVEISSIELSQAGKTIPVVVEGEIGVKVGLISKSGNATPYVAVMLCEGDEDNYIVRSFKANDSTTLTEGVEGFVNVTLNCTDATNKFVKVTVTESKNSSRRTAEDSQYPVGNELDAVSVLINGESIEGMESGVYEYEYIPAPGTQLPLSVNVVNKCSGVSSTIENITEFPGQIKITNTYGECEPVVYTINVTKPRPSVKVVSVSEKSLGAASYKVGGTAVVGSKLHSDSSVTISDFGNTDLEGADYVITHFADGKQENGFFPYENFITLSVNSPAEVYIGAYMKREDITNTNQYFDWILSFAEAYADENGNHRTMTLSDNKKLYFYKADIDTGIGENKEFKLKNVGKYGSGMYTIFVKWKDTSLFVESIKKNGNVIDGFSNNAEEYEVMNVESASDITVDLFDNTSSYVVNCPQGMVGEGSIVITNAAGATRTIKLTFVKGPEARIASINDKSVDKSAYGFVRNIGVDTKVHGDSTRKITGFNNSGLEGSDMIMTSYNDGLNENGFWPYEDFITFELNNSAEIYVGSYMKDSNSSDKFLDWISDFAEEYVDQEGNQHYISVGNNKLYLYKKTIVVATGEKENVALKNIGKYGNGMYVVFIKWIDTTLDVNSIKLNGTQIEGFTANGNNYVFESLDNSDVITVDLVDSSSSYVVNYPDNMVGEGSIVITNANGATRTINFTIVEDTSLEITSIKINGTEIAGFDPAVDEYTLTNVASTAVITVDLANDEAADYVVNMPSNMVGEGSIVITNSRMESRTIKLNFVFKPEVKVISVNSSLTTNAAGYIVAENAQIGSTIHSDDNARTITNFNNTGLEGATIVKTVNADSEIQADFAEFLTLEFNAPAEIYFGLYMRREEITNTNKYMGWITPYATPCLDENGDPIYVSVSYNGDPQVYLYKKYIDVAEGATVREVIKNIGKYGNDRMYTIFVKWVDTSLAVDSIKVNGVEIDGFAKDGDEYTLSEVGATDVITAQLRDSNSSYVVNTPDNMLGDGSIVITNQSGKTRTIKLKFVINPKVTNLVISDSSLDKTAYTIVNNIAIGQPLHLGGNARAISNFGGSGLEGSTIITTFFNDGVSSEVNRSSTDGFITFDINKSAEIYIGSYQGNANSSDGYMDWLSNYETYVDGQGTQYVLTAASNKSVKLYKKEVTVAEGSTVNVSIPSIGKYGNGMYSVFIKWKEQ